MSSWQALRTLSNGGLGVCAGAICGAQAPGLPSQRSGGDDGSPAIDYGNRCK